MSYPGYPLQYQYCNKPKRSIPWALKVTPSDWQSQRQKLELHLKQTGTLLPSELN